MGKNHVFFTKLLQKHDDSKEGVSEQVIESIRLNAREEGIGTDSTLCGKYSWWH